MLVFIGSMIVLTGIIIFIAVAAKKKSKGEKMGERENI